MNILMEIGKGVEVKAADALKFVETLKLEGQAIVSPRAMIALAVLLSAAGPVIVDATAAAAQDGLNIPLDAETAALIINLFPDLRAYAETLAIKPAKGATQ